MSGNGTLAAPTGQGLAAPLQFVEQTEADTKTGLWIGPGLMQLLANGVITPTECILLAYVQFFSYNDRKGCWASNEALAKRVASSEKYVSRMVTRLKRLGFLHDMSAPREPRLLRVKGLSPDKVVGTIEATKSGSPLPQKVAPTTATKSAPGMPQKVAQRKQERKQEGGGLPPAVAATPPAIGFGVAKPEQPTPWVAQARAYRKAMAALRVPVDWSTTKQANELHQLEKATQDPQLVEAVLAWYLEKMLAGKPQGLPCCTSPAQFKRRWSWVLDRYNEEAPPRKVELTPVGESHLATLREEFDWGDLDPYLPQAYADAATAFDPIIEAIRKVRRRHAALAELVLENAGPYEWLRMVGARQPVGMKPPWLTPSLTHPLWVRWVRECAENAFGREDARDRAAAFLVDLEAV